MASGEGGAAGLAWGVLAAWCVSATVAAGSPGAAGGDGRPNILLIVSEDNGPDLGCYGNRFVSTPNLDRLAAQGVRFDRAFVPQSGCSQSRAAYLTGLYPHQNGQIGLATWRFQLYREDTPNIVRSLKRAGYRTGIIGKLHVNPESAFPFDFVHIHEANFQRKNLDAYAENAAEFFGESDGPFFLSINYPDAHRPFLPQVGGLPEHPLRADEVATPPFMGLDTPTLRENTADYYNCMSRLDSLVGDLLAALRRSGKDNDTLIVYLGDHGADLLRGKRTSYEGGLRVPLIIQWPGRMKPGQVRRELVSTIDLAPTLLEAARADVVPSLPGRSLAPLIAGQSGSWRKVLFTEYHLHSNHNYFPQRTVRNDRYKLIQNLMPGRINPGYAFTIDHFYSREQFDEALNRAPRRIREAYARMRQPPEFELYDLKKDPYEFHNLAEDPGCQPVLRELKTELLAWRRRTRDPFLDPKNVLRLKAEVDATFCDGAYVKPDKWEYPGYLGPAASQSGGEQERSEREP